MLQDAGRSAHAVSSMQFVKNAPIVGPQDGVVVITHTGETAYALAARALAFSAGLQTVTICREARPASSTTAIQTVEKETSETYTVSYTTALLALGMLASAMGAGADSTADKLALVPGGVRNALESNGTESVPLPRAKRMLDRRARATRRSPRARARSRCAKGLASWPRATTRSTSSTGRRSR